jgi:hypothetical protein
MKWNLAHVVGGLNHTAPHAIERPAVLYGDDCPAGSQSPPPASSLSSGDFTIAVGSIGPIGLAFPGAVAVPIVVA